jgi:UPF0288 family protein (methanogenesis marker protein 3)
MQVDKQTTITLSVDEVKNIIKEYLIDKGYNEAKNIVFNIDNDPTEDFDVQYSRKVLTKVIVTTN